MAERHEIRFNGTGKALFGIYVVNVLLSILTVGIYAAWAKVKRLRYLYQNTEFAGDTFRFHGEGREILIGYLKVLLIMIILYALYIIGTVTGDESLILAGSGVLIIGLVLVVPLAIHGGLRYRLSRTSWRGIHWGYRGSKKEFFSLYLKGAFLTLITLGIYGSWMEARIRKYLFSHIRFGSVRISWQGRGGELFLIHLKGILLTGITLGIYYFWYRKNLFNYYYGQITAFQNDTQLQVSANLEGCDVFELLVINSFIMFFTLGLGYPVTVIRTIRMYAAHLVIIGDFDPDAVEQTEEDYRDATGEGFLDAFEIGDGLF